MAARLALGMLILVLGGCGVEVADRAAAADDAPREGRITLSLGELSGPDLLLFGQVSGVAMDVAGRIYVADRQASELRVFSAEGEPLYVAAPRGQGPGEVSGPCCPSFDADGRLWVRDQGNRRYLTFRPGPEGAELEGQLRFPHSDGGTRVAATFRGDTLVDVGNVSEPGARSVSPARSYLLPEGTSARTVWLPDPEIEELGGRSIQQVVTGGLATYGYSPPFGVRQLTAHGPGGVWAEARTDRYLIWLHTADGDTVRIELPTPEGPPPSAKQRSDAETALETSRASAERLGERLTWEVPDRMQPLEAIYFDTSGRLWVERTVTGGEPRVADLWSAEGVLLERRSWPYPARMTPAGWQGDLAALGVALDSLNVARILRVEW